jgi:hypothetical protein
MGPGRKINPLSLKKDTKASLVLLSLMFEQRIFLHQSMIAAVLMAGKKKTMEPLKRSDDTFHNFRIIAGKMVKGICLIAICLIFLRLLQAFCEWPLYHTISFP